MALPTYRLVVTVELERLSNADSAIDWRGASQVETLADLPTLLTLVRGDGIAEGVKTLMQRIVSEEDAKHHG